MPPKRKVAETEASSSTRPTRSSTRLSGANGDAQSKIATTTTTKTKATTSRSKKAAVTEEKDEDAPPAKKAKTTAAKAKGATKTAKGKKGQKDAETNGMTGGGADASTSKSKAQPKSTSNANAAQNPEPYTPARSLSLFQSYVDEDDSDVIGPEGLEKLCNDAQISVEGALPMILAWQFQTSEMMKIKKDEWIKGTEGLRICSLPVLQIALTDLDELLIQNKSPKAAKSNAKEKDREKDLYDKTSYRTYASNPQVAFQKLYTFCFNLVKPEQSRNIDMETASALWSVLLVPKYPVMTEVIEFIEAKPSYKAVNKDLWSMMLEFCETVKPDLSNYEADGAWPTLLDDFAATKRDASAPSATATSE